MYDNSTGAHSKAAFYRGEIERLTNKLAAVSRFPETDPCVDGDVIKFDRVYPGESGIGGVRYSYAAIRAAGQWYTTGRNGSSRAARLSWSGLVEFMGEDVDEVILFTAGRQIVPNPGDGEQVGWVRIEPAPPSAADCAHPVGQMAREPGSETDWRCLGCQRPFRHTPRGFVPLV